MKISTCILAAFASLAIAAGPAPSAAAAGGDDGGSASATHWYCC